MCNSSVCIRVLSTWAVDPDVSCLKTTCTLNRGLGEVLLSPLIALERACKEHLTFRRKASSTIQSIFSVYVTQCCCTWKHTHIHHTNTHILAAYHLLADTHTHVQAGGVKHLYLVCSNTHLQIRKCAKSLTYEYNTGKKTAWLKYQTHTHLWPVVVKDLVDSAHDVDDILVCSFESAQLTLLMSLLDLLKLQIFVYRLAIHMHQQHLTYLTTALRDGQVCSLILIY